MFVRYLVAIMDLKLLILTISLVCADFGEDVLGKFNQHDYKVKNTRVDLVSYDKSVYRFYDVHVFKYNRTQQVINISLNYFIDMLDKSEVLVQGYKFMSNEYRDFPMRFEVNAYKAFKVDIIGLKEAAETCGYWNASYHIKDTTYYLCNLIFNEKKLPPFFPTGMFKNRATFKYLGKEISVLDFYGEVYRPIYPPKDKW